MDRRERQLMKVAEKIDMSEKFRWSKEEVKVVVE